MGEEKREFSLCRKLPFSYQPMKMKGKKKEACGEDLNK